MRNYGETAVDRLYKKLKQDITDICRKILYQTGFYYMSVEELEQEARILFFTRFEEYYETNNQYLRFLFIAIKNKVRTEQKKTYRYVNRFKNMPPMDDEEPDFHKALENVAGKNFHGISMDEVRKELQCSVGESKVQQYFDIVSAVVEFGGWSKAFKKHGINGTRKREAIKGEIRQSLSTFLR